MSSAYERLLRPLLFRAYGGDAERVHEGNPRRHRPRSDGTPLAAAGRGGTVCARHRTPTTVAGIDFPGLVGLAAGMDKNGVGVRSWSALGFGHAEIGTVTARAQPGNDRPRLFRLPASRAIVNRMGFNNPGAAALSPRPWRPPGCAAATLASACRSASRSARPRSFRWRRPRRTT